MSLTENSDTFETIDITLTDIEKWNKKHCDENVAFIVKEVIKFTKSKNNMNIIKLSLGKRCFNILCPITKTESYVVEYDGSGRLLWIDDINLFCINKSPTITKLLNVLHKQIEKMKDEDVKEVKLTKLNDHIDMTTQLGFDLEKYKKKKELETYLSTSTCDKTTLRSGNESKQQSKESLFGKTVVGRIVVEEFMELWELGKTHKKKFSLDIVNNNIFHWKVKFYDFDRQQLKESLKTLKDKFGYDYIEVDVFIHDTLYPNYPPTVKVIRPRLSNSMMHRISNTRMIKLDYWTPTRSMAFIINKLQQLLDKNAEICTDVELNCTKKHSDGAFLKIETLLMDLASNVETKGIADIDDEIYENYSKLKQPKTGVDTMKKKIVTRAKDQNAIWTSGTGYGHNGSKEWNVDTYLKSIEERDKIIQSILSKIINEIQDTKDDIKYVYDAMKHSILLNYLKSQLNDTTLLEINKHTQLFSLIFNLIGNLANEQAIEMFHETSEKSLFNIITELNVMCKTAVKYDKTEDDTVGTIMTIYSMIDPIYKSFVETLQLQQETKLKSEKEKISKEQEYIKKMIELRDSDDEHKLVGSGYYYQKDFDHNKSHKLPTEVIKRLRNEFVAFNSLPISYNAIIISRPDKDYMTAIRTLMTGPDKTPYECGIFLFDTYINTNFPHSPPNVWYLNTGRKRFNPNLYDSGKVCLSILGTWSGDKGSESWNSMNSTLIQIYISIQAQILVEQPFYNEPGYESRYNNVSGRQQSTEYNNNIRLYTMNHAMLDLIKNPNAYPQFADVIKAHFSLKKNNVIEICEKWVSEAPSSMITEYTTTFNAIKAELSKF